MSSYLTTSCHGTKRGGMVSCGFLGHWLFVSERVRKSSFDSDKVWVDSRSESSSWPVSWNNFVEGTAIACH